LADHISGKKADEFLKPFINRKLHYYPTKSLRFMLLNGAIWFLKRSVLGGSFQKMNRSVRIKEKIFASAEKEYINPMYNRVGRS